MVLFRAIVMLACLVLVPMAAIFGSAFPSLIQSCLPDSWQSVVKDTSSAANGDAPSFGAMSSHPAASAAPAPQWPATTGGAAKPTNANATGAAPESSAAKFFETGAAPLRRSIPTAAPAGNVELAGRSNVPAAFSSPADMSGVRVASNSRAMSGQDETFTKTGDFRNTTAPPAGAWPSAASAKPADPPDRFTTIEQQLRSYGATHYHLETWGQRGELYRFQCQMPATTHGGASPAFEAVDASALEAMQRVLKQVETLRSTAKQ